MWCCKRDSKVCWISKAFKVVYEFVYYVICHFLPFLHSKGSVYSFVCMKDTHRIWKGKEKISSNAYLLILL